jgi:hypothetical protein
MIKPQLKKTLMAMGITPSKTCLKFHNRVILTLSLPNSKTVAFFRCPNSPHWYPFSGISPLLGDSWPALFDTYEYSTLPKLDGTYGDPSLHRYGCLLLKELARILDQNPLPAARETHDIREVNNFIGSQHAFDLNRTYDLWDHDRLQNGERPIQSLVSALEQKHKTQPPSKDPLASALPNLLRKHLAPSEQPPQNSRDNKPKKPCR